MSGKITNLRTARKQKARDEKRGKSRAGDGAAGISKPTLTLEKHRQKIENERLDGHKVDD